jgi:hypothetical protein
MVALIPDCDRLEPVLKTPVAFYFFRCAFHIP